MLLAAYGLRRPTADIDGAALQISNEAEGIRQFITAVLTKTLPEQFGQALESLKDFANPVISGSTADQATWDPGRRTWNRAD